MKKLRIAYHGQKSNAKRRGIEWEFTFESWLEWWGEDIANRGTGHDKLQMQRFGDSGPYSPSNTKKGYPQDNSATFRRVVANRKAKKAAEDHERFLDALMWAQSKENKEYDGDADRTEKERDRDWAIRPRFTVDKRL